MKSPASDDGMLALYRQVYPNLDDEELASVRESLRDYARIILSLAETLKERETTDPEEGR